jgi:hypothetical protein
MAIEKVFEIEGPPDAIWAALWADLAEGENATYSQLESSWPERLSLRVVLAAIPCRLTFTIEPAGRQCEVTASLEPEGFRYRLFQVITFGHARRNFEILLATSLANLKEAVEGHREPDAFHTGESSSANNDPRP